MAAPDFLGGPDKITQSRVGVGAGPRCAEGV